jgi:ADP-heptose:LPS heptosyltransferase
VNIVLSRTDRVGDLVLSTPAIASFRRSFPQAHIALVCSVYNRAAVEGNPDLDELIAIEPPCAPGAAQLGLRRRYDLAVALAPRVVDFRIVAATKAPRRIGYTYTRRYLARFASRLFLTDLAISEADPYRCEVDPACVVRHEVDQVLTLVELAGGRSLYRDLVIAINDADRAAVAGVPAGAITLHLGHRWATTGSTIENVVQLLRDLRMFGRPIVVTYGDDAEAIVNEVRDAGVADFVIGHLSFGAWAAAFEKSALVVTVDTAATHVASAVRRPIVVLFEHRYFRLNSQEWSPYRVPSVVLRKPSTPTEESLRASREQVVQAVAQLLEHVKDLSRHPDI